MAVQYNRLWKYLIGLKMIKTELQRASGVSANVMARLSRDDYVSLESIEKICSTLHCAVDSILEFVPGKAEFAQSCYKIDSDDISREV